MRASVKNAVNSAGQCCQVLVVETNNNRGGWKNLGERPSFAQLIPCIGQLAMKSDPATDERVKRKIFISRFAQFLVLGTSDESNIIRIDIFVGTSVDQFRLEIVAIGVWLVSQGIVVSEFVVFLLR